MKIFTIIPVAKPKSFADVDFHQKEYAAALKRGPVDVPGATAKEALVNSKGLYRIKSDEKKVEVEIKGAKEPEDMTPSELVAEMTSHGKPPRKKMARAAAVAFVRDLREKAAEMIVDDEDE
ncbi:hypothetical protein [Ruegeria sp. EL01]|uniref:hypothetical protein n=1 Tax=Ruegeria sp. EL01 TaxID=2107578 RepID=UPI0013C3E9D7|nr:hypothetical protein [Ruegeria sp. EL01]